MSLYVINIGNASAKQWVQFSYEKTLNGMSNCQFALDGVTGGYVAEFDVDKEIYIYKGGVLKFRGITNGQDSLSGGGMVLYALGIEVELTESKAPMVGSLTTRAWAATSDHTILSTLVTSVSGWTIDTSNSTGENIDFRTSATESVWNAVINMISQTGKDIWIDQENKKVYLYDEYTRDNKFSFIEGKNATDIMRSKTSSKAAKVIIYGKGDGENQIIGSYGSGTPVYSYIDRNILSTTEANKRALTEYNKLNPQLKSYSFTPTEPIDSLQVGDMGTIANNSASINEEVDIVRIKTIVNNKGIEDIEMEVTNPDYRIASKNVAEERAKSEAGYIQSQTSMQGSGNINTWGSGINAKTDYPLKIGFYLSEAQIQDEAGNLRINSLIVDYDIDPYNSQFGTASFSGSDPQVQNSSGSTAPDVAGSSGNTAPDVAGSSGSTAPDVAGASGITWSGSTIGTDSQTSVTCPSGQWTAVCAVGLTGTNRSVYANFYIKGNSGGDEDIMIKLDNSGIATATDSVWGSYHDGFRDAAHVRMNGINVASDYSGHSVTLDVYPFTGEIVVDGYLQLYYASHSHDDGSYAAANHPHDDGSFAAANHPHDDGSYAAASHPHTDGTYDINAADLNYISIADGVGEAGSVNASSVNIYLDYWNTGTSTWDNKHSVLNTGATIGNNVDITNSGAYPDAVGFWRVRIEPITATADFAQGIVRLKSAIDN